MSSRYLALVAALVLPSCVLLDLFPEEGGGAGGSGGTGMGGATSTGATGSTVSTTGAGGSGGVTVEMVTGASPRAGVGLVRFLDVDVSQSEVVVVGHVRSNGGGLSLGLPGCGELVPVPSAYFVARFETSEGACTKLDFYDAGAFSPPLTGSIVHTAGGEVVVAVSDADRTEVSRAVPGSKVLLLGSPIDGVVTADLVACEGNVYAGGLIARPAPTSCFQDGAAPGDADAWLTRIDPGVSCGLVPLAHTEPGTEPQRVVSVACEADRVGATIATLSNLSINGMSFGGSSSNALYQEVLPSITSFALGDFTCDVSPSYELRPPRVVFAPGANDWMFGPICGDLVAWRRDQGNWAVTSVTPRPAFFDKPSIALGPGLLLFGGEYYDESEGAPPWRSGVLTGVVGGVDDSGAVQFTFDVVGGGAEADTEVTGMATDPTRTTAWVVGNYRSPAVTIGDATFTANSITCSSSEPCKPFLAKLRL